MREDRILIILTIPKVITRTDRTVLSAWWSRLFHDCNSPEESLKDRRVWAISLMNFESLTRRCILPSNVGIPKQRLHCAYWYKGQKSWRIISGLCGACNSRSQREATNWESWLISAKFCAKYKISLNYNTVKRQCNDKTWRKMKDLLISGILALKWSTHKRKQTVNKCIIFKKNCQSIYMKRNGEWIPDNKPSKISRIITWTRLETTRALPELSLWFPSADSKESCKSPESETLRGDVSISNTLINMDGNRSDARSW